MFDNFFKDLKIRLVSKINNFLTNLESRYKKAFSFQKVKAIKVYLFLNPVYIRPNKFIVY